MLQHDVPRRICETTASSRHQLSAGAAAYQPSNLPWFQGTRRPPAAASSATNPGDGRYRWSEVRDSLGVKTELEVGLILAFGAWALSALSAVVAWLVRGRVAKRADESLRLAEVGVAVQALVDALGVVDLASNDFATQHGRLNRYTNGLLALIELADGWRQDRVTQGMARSLERTLEHDRTFNAAAREFSAGPLHALTAAHLRLTMTAADLPELTAAADSAADAAGELTRARVRGRPAAERQAAQAAFDKAVTAFGLAWRKVSGPAPKRWHRRTKRREAAGPDQSEHAAT